MRVIVLGAGVVGVTAAWYLRQDGHDVTVVDRHEGAALETSFANGGQISASYAEPWANPEAPAKIIKWLGQEDAPLLFRLRLDPAQWRWGLQFLVECLPSRTRHNTIQCLNLALYSRECLKRLRADTSIRYDQLERGILQFYTEPAEFERGVEAAGLMREFGCDRDNKSGARGDSRSQMEIHSRRFVAIRRPRADAERRGVCQCIGNQLPEPGPRSPAPELWPHLYGSG